MDSYSYQAVKNSEERSYWESRLLFIKQLFVCSSVILNFFIIGLCTGSLTVMIPQLRKEVNSTDVINADTVSWIVSMPALSALPWSIILPFLAERYGRKITLLMLNVNTFITTIVFYTCKNVTEIILSKILEGILLSSISNLSVMVLSEYTSPKYRGTFFALKSATFYWGVLVANTIGTFFHWKKIGFVIFACCIYNFVIIFYPESPYWLARNKRFEQCAKTHRWLKGTDEDAENELETLIMSYQHIENDKKTYGVIVKFYKIITTKIFYKPLIFAFFTICLYNLSGKLVYTVYAIDIIQKITDSEKVAYGGMLILDAVTVFGMYVGSAFTKVLNRRTQLLVLASMGVVFLFIMSLYLYLIKLTIFEENKYISLFLFSGFSLSFSCGPMVLLTCCHGEMAPFKYRFSYLTITSVLSYMVGSLVFKVSPTLFQECGTHGAFFFYAVSASVFIYLLYRYLPETKDKTIQEIESFMAKDDKCHKQENVPLSSNTLGKN